MKRQFTVQDLAVQNVISEAIRVDDGQTCRSFVRAEGVMEALDKAGFVIIPKPRPGWTTPDRIEFARRTGCWDGVSDKDYMDWVRSLVPGGFVLRTLAEVTAENEKGWAAAVEALDRDEDLPGYGKAVRLLRGRLPSVVELADALGDASPDGPEGNVWKLRDRIDRGPPAGGFWAAPEGLPPGPAAKFGRVVVLDEAGERKLQDLLAGKSVPTGRIVEVTYRKPDGSTETHRHAEFAQIDSVSFDPPPVIGGKVAGARVLRATETVKLEPGKPAAASAGVFDRDVQILGIFWADGIISFAGDAADMAAFRDMAATVVGAPRKAA